MLTVLGPVDRRIAPARAEKSRRMNTPMSTETITIPTRSNGILSAPNIGADRPKQAVSPDDVRTLSYAPGREPNLRATHPTGTYAPKRLS